MEARKRILYVDDNQDACELIKIYFELASYEVIIATTISDGMRSAEQEKFDLYLVDFRLPDGTGLDFALHIKQLRPETPLVFHTASAFPEDIKKGFEAGACAYITKPCDPNKIIEVINKILLE